MTTQPTASADSQAARYVTIGGFFGAGKTTAIDQFGRYLKAQGLRVGLITNDQGNELVDTAMLRARGFTAEEVLGGCLCQQLGSVTGAAERLREKVQADVLIAEPVGSCTDLFAAVSAPLPCMLGSGVQIAPLSVLVDPVLGARIFGLESGSRFSEKVAYIYRKQIEQSDILVINKADTASAQELKRLRSVLAEHARQATIFTVSARSGLGLEEWFAWILHNQHVHHEDLSVDKNLYAQGEAQLGWLNCTVRLSSVRYFDAGKVLSDLASCLQTLLQQESAEIAHLKITLKPVEDMDGIAAINLVRNDQAPELSQDLPEPVQSGRMILNLRAEADPEVLHSAVTRALLALMEKSPDLFARMEHSEHFRPTSIITAA